jgi:DNA-binding MarR family transcriptional regulator
MCAASAFYLYLFSVEHSSKNYTMSKEILREFGKIYRALNSFADFLMKSIKLEKGQYQFLMRVKENPGINQQGLSSILLVDKTTTAKAINKLVDKGFIIKKVAHKDKRNFNLFLTKKGKETCRLLDKEEQFVTRISVGELNDLEQKILLEQLAEISKNVTHLFTELKDDKKEHFLKLINQEKL